MTREYDAHSRPNSKEFREQYDRIFKRAKDDRAKRAQRRQGVEELENEAAAQGVPTRRGLR